jgi:hypothetical protein
MMNNDERNLLEKNLDRINFWIQNVDAKNSFLLALSGVIIGFVFTSDSFDKSITSYIKDVGPSISWSAIYAIINLSLFVASIIAIGNCLRLFLSSLKGRIDPSIWNEEDLDTKSTIHFQTIAASKNFREYKRRFKRLDTVQEKREEVEANDLLSQVYINSKIVTTKFNLYNRGIKSLTIGVALLFLFKMLSFISW